MLVHVQSDTIQYDLSKKDICEQLAYINEKVLNSLNLRLPLQGEILLPVDEVEVTNNPVKILVCLIVLLRKIKQYTTTIQEFYSEVDVIPFNVKFTQIGIVDLTPSVLYDFDTKLEQYLQNKQHGNIIDYNMFSSTYPPENHDILETISVFFNSLSRYEEIVVIISQDPTEIIDCSDDVKLKPLLDIWQLWVSHITLDIRYNNLFPETLDFFTNL